MKLKVKQVLTNPKVMTFLLTCFFSIGFAITPYSTMGALLVTFAGMTTMIAWGNILNIWNIGEKLKECVEEVTRHSQKIETFNANLNDDFDKIQVIELTNDGHNDQTYHTVSVLLGVTFIAAGSVIELYANGLKSNSRNATTTACNNHTDLTQTGSGLLAGGFAVAAFSNWYLFNKVADKYAESKKIRKKMREEIKKIENPSKEKILKNLIKTIAAIDHIQSEKEKSVELEREANRFGYTCQDVRGDGRCFYHAVVDQLREFKDFENVTPESLIVEVADHMLNYMSDYESFIIGNPDELLSSIINKEEWADHLMIQALSRALNINIAIIRDDGGEALILRQQAAVGTIFIGYQVGIHYQSLHRNDYVDDVEKDIQQYIDQSEIDNFHKAAITQRF